MRTVEKYRSQHFENPANLEAYARQFGLDAASLDRHLSIMTEVADGRLSQQSRAWLHERAAKAGVDKATANRMIQQVLSQPHAEARAAAYINGAGQGNVSPETVRAAMELHKAYSQTEASMLTEDRLVARDQHMDKQGLGYRFEDRPEFQQARQESSAVRKALEASMVSSGLVAPPARSLEEAQHRAHTYANKVADRLEARMKLGKEASLRDAIEDSYLAADAMAKKADVGLVDEDFTLGQVAENAERDTAYSGSLNDIGDSHE